MTCQCCRDGDRLTAQVLGLELCDECAACLRDLAQEVRDLRAGIPIREKQLKDYIERLETEVRDLRASVEDAEMKMTNAFDEAMRQTGKRNAAEAHLEAQTVAIRCLAAQWREIVARCDREDTGNPLTLSRLMQCAAEVDALSATSDGLAETERLHSADCRAQEAQRQRDADALQAEVALRELVKEWREQADVCLTQSRERLVDDRGALALVGQHNQLQRCAEELDALIARPALSTAAETPVSPRHTEPR